MAFFKHFRIQVVVRVLILLGLLCLLAYGLFQRRPEWQITNALVIALIAIATIEMIRYVEKLRRDLSQLLLSLKYRDFTLNFNSIGQGKSIRYLHDAFNEIITGYRELRLEKEMHYQYLQTAMDHVGVALICFEDTGEIQLMNQAAQQILGRPYLHSIQGLEKVHPDLFQQITHLQPRQQELVKVLIEGNMRQLSLRCSDFKLQDETFKLISLQDIRRELDEREIETWQKLIRVLTHEIMNSVTPIISLTKGLNQQFVDETGEPLHAQDISEDSVSDTLAGLRTIENRSQGLLHFVHTYRNLTRVPNPTFQDIEVRPLVQRIYQLLEPELAKHQIAFHIEEEEENLVLLADSNLIEQVLINLIKNALEALQGRQGAQITITLTRTQDRDPMILVADNGPGIDEELQDQLFIPFFTTKPQGSGIGLSLARQIMRLHRGSISFQSNPKAGTTFMLVF